MTGELEAVFSVSDFVASLNQTFDYAYPYVEVVGELSNLRISKNKWVYFDLKDEQASMRCFGTVYIMPGPLEDGMMVRLSGSPRMHPVYSFSFTIQSIVPAGKGALKKAADLLAAKLKAEGLFDAARKRVLPTAPRRIALITAGQSAAYADFIKIAQARWSGLIVDHYDVLVQGDQAPGAIVAALATVSNQSELPDAVVVIRGGGSADDLAAFSDERVVRAVAGSRVPTVVAIGHEIDVSLAELAADMRASTPSNAAELLLPDKKVELQRLSKARQDLDRLLQQQIAPRLLELQKRKIHLDEFLERVFVEANERLSHAERLLAAYDPKRPLSQGYALARLKGQVVTGGQEIGVGDIIEIEFTDVILESQVKSKQKKG